MPEPIYIICSESSRADAPLRKLNLYNVIETVGVLKTEPEVQSKDSLPSEHLPIHINAAWMQAKDETVDQSFEFNLILALSPNGEEFLLGQGNFTFSEGPVYRITAVGEMATFGGPGVARIICRVRCSDSKDSWIEQAYRINVQEVPPPVLPIGSGSSDQSKSERI